ncbi:MAG: AAA family ATPase [Gemmataceae bacterium]
MGNKLAGPYLRSMRLKREMVASFVGYPFCLPAVKELEELAFHPKVTFLVGENGSGKSTLLEAVAIASHLNPEGGSNNFRFRTRSSHSELYRFLELAWRRTPLDRFFLRAESFYNVATEVENIGMFAAYGGLLHEQSHGESFFSLFTNRFRGDGLYLLDEPEAALSPNRQMSLLTLMHDYCRQGSQFIIATHSPIILAYPDALIYHLSDQGVNEILYEDTEHYRVTKMFLTRTQKMLDQLLADD